MAVQLTRRFAVLVSDLALACIELPNHMGPRRHVVLQALGSANVHVQLLHGSDRLTVQLVQFSRMKLVKLLVLMGASRLTDDLLCVIAFHLGLVRPLPIHHYRILFSHARLSCFTTVLQGKEGIISNL